MIAFRKVEISDAKFIQKLMIVKDYQDIFYEKDTSAEEWQNRIELLKKDKGTDNYIISDLKQNKTVGWIIYEVENEACFLHLIVIDYKELGKKYGYNSLKKLVYELKNKSVERILLDVQKSNFGAIDFYKQFGFVIIGSERQVVNNNKIQEYLKMEYVL